MAADFQDAGFDGELVRPAAVESGQGAALDGVVVGGAGLQVGFEDDGFGRVGHRLHFW